MRAAFQILAIPYRIIDGSPEDALRTAPVASAIVVTKPGAAETIPDRETVERFLRAHC